MSVVARLLNKLDESLADSLEATIDTFDSTIRMNKSQLDRKRKDLAPLVRNDRSGMEHGDPEAKRKLESAISDLEHQIATDQKCWEAKSDQRRAVLARIARRAGRVRTDAMA